MRLLILLLLVVNTAWAKAAPSKLEPSVLLYNLTDNTVVHAEHTQEVRPMASITKVMTALVALELHRDPKGKVAVYKGLGGILPKKEFTRHEILTAMIVRSDNSAAETLARDHPQGRTAFLEAMNSKARQLGMSNTHFDDPSGLSKLNTSTALDIMIMLREALTNETLRNLGVIQRTEITVEGKKKPAKVLVQNTNVSLLEQFNSITFSKTGLTTPAGWCVALALEERNKNYALIVLGAANKEHRKKIVERTVYSQLR
jgi:D-alanyl-D-alanine endopeptidase (penicillin-binding protein 7)